MVRHSDELKRLVNKTLRVEQPGPDDTDHHDRGDDREVIARPENRNSGDLLLNQ